MKPQVHLFLGVAIIAVALAAVPAADLAGGNTQPAGYQQEVQGVVPPRLAGDASAGYTRSGGQEDGKSRSHATRVAGWTASSMSGPLKNPPIPNFGVVEEGILYRSAQPDDAQLKWLVGQGFKSIVSFRRETGDHTRHMADVGFTNSLWLNIEDETNPSDVEAERFLDFVTDSRNWPVLIHCKVGLGRTGTMAALVRYAIDGWSMQDAIKEAKLYRGGVDLVPSQSAWLNHWASNHPPGCHRPLPPAGRGG